MSWRSSWKSVVVLAGVVLLVTYGTRNSIALFLVPATTELGIGRETFSLAIALQNLVFGLPFLGMLADRIGSRVVLAFSVVVFAASLLWFGSVQSSAALFGSLGVVMGMALAGGTFTVVFGAVAKATPERYRSTALGAVAAIGSAGALAMSLLSQRLIDTGGWRVASMWLAAVMAIALVAALAIPSANLAADEPAEPGELSRTVRQAAKDRSYVLMVTGFFVCGFHVTFIGIHYPAFLSDQGLSPSIGAAAIGLIGVANVVGTLLFGRLGDRYPKRVLLSILYAARGLFITALLLVPMTPFVAYAFAISIGVVWLATAPLTSGMVASRFGTRYLATLYGIVFFSHQIGAFLGVWLGGRFYDLTGSYRPVWIIAIVLAVAAAVVHLPIKERRVEVPSPA